MPPHQENKEWKKDLKELMGNELYFRDFVNFISDLLSAKSTEIEEELKKLKDWEELQVGESEQIDECIKIIKKILR